MRYTNELLDVEFNIEGVYDITLYTGNGCGIDSVTQQICALPRPTADFILSNDHFCDSGVVNFTNNSTRGACGIDFQSDWVINFYDDQSCSHLNLNLSIEDKEYNLIRKLRSFDLYKSLEKILD